MGGGGGENKVRLQAQLISRQICKRNPSKIHSELDSGLILWSPFLNYSQF